MTPGEEARLPGEEAFPPPNQTNAREKGLTGDGLDSVTRPLSGSGSGASGYAVVRECQRRLHPARAHVQDRAHWQ
jgi:hypothetical protein